MRVLTLPFLLICRSGNLTADNVTQILNSLVDKYDKRLRPNYGADKVDIAVTIHVSTISAISEVEMDFTLDMYLRQYWNDPRLAFNHTEQLTVGIEMVNEIWVPDTFFPNEKRSFFHDATTHNSFLRIKPSGEVLRSLRLTVTAMCPMDLVNFPLDSQNCSLEIESYGYSVADIYYAWRNESDPLKVSEGINLAQFSLKETLHRQRKIGLSTGAYSRLSADFVFKRNIGFYLIQIYLPSSLIVIISWVSFWLNREATQARVAIGVTTVLTMTTLMTSTNAAMPKVSYVKSIDIYLGFCFIIVFASLLEYAAVGYLMKRMRMRRERKDTKGGMTYYAFAGPPTAFNATPHHMGPRHTTLKISNDSLSYELQPMNTETSTVQSTIMDNRYLPGYGQIPDVNPPECDCDVENDLVPTRRRTLRLRPKYRRHKKRKFKPSSIDKYSRIFFPLIFSSFHVIYWTVYLNAVESR